jgi:hypothetical protein
MFESGKKFHGSLAEKYMRSRKLFLTPDQSFDIRFVPEMNYRGFADAEAKEETRLGSFPCMVAAIRDHEDKIVGVHMTYLDRKGESKLSGVGDVRRFKAKKQWPSNRGRIRLSPPCENMCMGEGMETTVAWFQMGLGPKNLGMCAGVNLGNMAGRMTGRTAHPKFPEDKRYAIPNGIPDMDSPLLVMPDYCKHLVLLGDGDSDWHWTRANILACGRRNVSLGRTVSVSFAPDNFDFGDVLMGAVK